MGMTRIIGGTTTVTRSEDQFLNDIFEAAMDHQMENAREGYQPVEAEPHLKVPQNGEDFFFEVPKHPANHLFAGRLQRLGFERSSLISHDECDRFYMPEGTDVELVTKEYLEYFPEGDVPEVKIIPLGFLTPSVEREPVVQSARKAERQNPKKSGPRELVDDVPVFARRQQAYGWPPEN